VSIFKDCDIRGIYHEELDEKMAYRIGGAAGTLLEGKDIVVCGDVRPSTKSLKKSFIDGLFDTGAKITDIGIAPTPVAYFAKSRDGLNAYGLAIITASHNPAKYNGIKLMFGETPIMPETIKKIEELAVNERFVQKTGSYKEADVFGTYQSHLHNLTGMNSLKITLDCGNGTNSLCAPEIFRSFGYQLDELYCHPDGAFPNRDPNPAVYSNLSEVCRQVPSAGSDFGVAYDGDGDRAVFIDNRGNVVQSEKAFVMLINGIAEKKFSIVYDQKCSSIVRNEVLKLGGKPIMERSGHVFIKKTFLENESALGGEISGHYFFKELGYDDAIYATLKMGEIIQQSGKSLSELVNQIPTPCITPDIRVSVPYEEQDGILEKIRDAYQEYPINNLDGIRITFSGGWILVRKSVTEPALTLRIEALTQDGIRQIKDHLNQIVPELQLD